MEHNLLTSLRKYRPREGHDPLENFITEAFAWILKSYPDFSTVFVSYLLEKIPHATKDVEQLSWSTQENFNGFYPDMLCEMGNGRALVFENKAWAKLHNSQLDNYRQYAENNYTESHIILITATSNQHVQNPDLALCWSDIYRFITDWLKQHNTEGHCIFKDFLELLRDEGMAPPAPISHESIQSYYSGIELTPQINSLLNTVKRDAYWKNIISAPDLPDLTVRGSDGRIGFDLLGRKTFGGEVKEWIPGVFIGFMMNGTDHCVKNILGRKSPDFSIIISFNKLLHNIYPTSAAYQSFVSKISKEISVLNQGWNFLNHLEDKSAKEINRWHPIHIRKPILELFVGTLTAAEQANRFMENAKQILDIIFNCDEFAHLKAECLLKTSPIQLLQ